MRVFSLVATVLLSLPVFGQKTVLIEKFTSAFCGACAGASVDLLDIQKEYPNTIWISHHKWTTWTDYPLDNQDSRELWSDIGVLGTPMGAIDRKVSGTRLTTGQGNWRSAIEESTSEEANVDIDIEVGAFSSDTRSLDFSVTVSALKDISKNLRITAVIVEDSVWGVEQHSYFNDVAGHPLEGKGNIIWAYPHRNVVRAILENPWGVEYIIPYNFNKGDDVSYQFNYDFPDEHRMDRSQIVCFVTEHDTSDDLRRSVLNAKKEILRSYLTSYIEETTVSSITLYPNPVDNVLYIESTKNIDAIWVTDMTGRIVARFSGKNVTSADISCLSDGLYQCQIMIGDRVETHSMLVRN